MRSRWMAAAVACGLVACGGGDGGGDENRTDIACAWGEVACATKHYYEVPSQLVCDTLGQFREVSSCPGENVLATCTTEKESLRVVTRIYDPTSLDGWEQSCAYDGGTWVVHAAAR